MLPPMGTGEGDSRGSGKAAAARAGGGRASDPGVRPSREANLMMRDFFKFNLPQALLVLFTFIAGLAAVAAWLATRDLVAGAGTTAERQLRAYVFVTDARMVSWQVGRSPQVRLTVNEQDHRLDVDVGPERRCFPQGRGKVDPSRRVLLALPRPTSAR